MSASHPSLVSLEGLAPFAGKYRVVRVLGEGGMGFVFEARHKRTGHRFAIKVLGSALRDYPDLVARFEREARACGALSSPNAVKIFDIDKTEDGTPYIVMELLTGYDLAAILADEGPQSIGKATRWVLDACGAISEAHRLGIVHRDIKPSNLFVAEVDGVATVKVLDFGIAKVSGKAGDSAITHAMTPLGTPQYMSPEQVRSAKDVDERTDVWSLGVTLYELVVGHTPFDQAKDPAACIAMIAADPVPDPRTFRPGLPEDFAVALMKALEKNVTNRYSTVDELAAALGGFAEQEVTRPRRTISKSDVTLAAPAAGAETADTMPPLSRLDNPGLRSRRNRLWALACAAVLGVCAFAIPKWATDAADAHASGGASSVIIENASQVESRAPSTTSSVDAAVAAPPTEPKPAALEVAKTPAVETARVASRPGFAPRTAQSGLQAPIEAPNFPVRAPPRRDSIVHGGLTSGPGF